MTEIDYRLSTIHAVADHLEATANELERRLRGSEMGDIQRQRESRARIRAERNGDPSWTDLGDGYFALHIQFGGNAVIVRVQGGDPPGAEDIAALREWLDYHWPEGE